MPSLSCFKNQSAVYLKWTCLVLSLGLAWSSGAQSANVSCETAFEIPDELSWCSGPEEFNNTNAGPSGVPEPDCFDGAENDLWFTFVATRKAVHIQVDGEERGKLDDPQVALYEGDDCGGLIDLDVCVSEDGAINFASIFTENLKIGQRYYIRVAAEDDEVGTFQFCVSSYHPAVLAGQDCATASVLCDKDLIVVQRVEGGGDDPDEAPGTCITVGSGNSERASTWFKWTVGESGTLTFDIKPLLITNDIDFILYRIIGDINSCEKEIIRCNGTNGGDFEPCGPNTGLNLTSTDVEEDPDCDSGEDGYLQYIDMLEGEHYALLVNNFNAVGGYTLEFGGTGTFLQPEFEFEVNPLDLTGCAYTFEAAVTSDLGVGAIYEWDFGPGAEPQLVTGPSPQQVEYADNGAKTITVSFVSDLGCRVTESLDLPCFLEPSFALQFDSLRNVECNIPGLVEISGSDSCGGTYEFFLQVDDLLFTGNRFEGLGEGDYEIRVVDENGCDAFFPFTIANEFEGEIMISSMPVDDGTCDLKFEFEAILGGDFDPGVGLSWSFGAGASPTTASGAGPHEVVYNDRGEVEVSLEAMVSADCTIQIEERITIEDCTRSEGLELQVLSVEFADCNDEGGVILVDATAGCPEYLFRLNGGQGNPEGLFTNLTSGVYTVELEDDDGCVVSAEVTVGMEEGITLDAGPDITVNRLNDTIQFDFSTSIPPEEIAWSPVGSLFCTDGREYCLNPVLVPQASAVYTIMVTDSSGCIATDEVRVTLDIDYTQFVFAPNIFSPNEDGINDLFTLFTDRTFVENIEELVIFDRWGNKVYEGFNLGSGSEIPGWDGRMNNRPAVSGVYTWYAKIQFADLTGENIQVLSGDVTLIR